MKAALPPALGKQIENDACALAARVASLLPSSPTLEVKLEIFGGNGCVRWHQDHYVARAIVSYTGAVATMYTDDSNVNFWELNHCGHNDCIIKNPQEVYAADTGNFLLIKGKTYPAGAKGLVHKSPEIQYHPSGQSVVNRLVLKVDAEYTKPDAEGYSGLMPAIKCGA